MSGLFELIYYYVAIGSCDFTRGLGLCYKYVMWSTVRRRRRRRRLDARIVDMCGWQGEVWRGVRVGTDCTVTQLFVDKNNEILIVSMKNTQSGGLFRKFVLSESCLECANLLKSTF